MFLEPPVNSKVKYKVSNESLKFSLQNVIYTYCPFDVKTPTFDRRFWFQFDYLEVREGSSEEHVPYCNITWYLTKKEHTAL